MIDTLVAFEGQINASRILTELNINNDPYILMTIHRPSNVDSKDSLTKVLDLIDSVSTDQRVVFPVHPRTLGRFTEFGLQSRVEHNKNLVTSAPLAYFDFQKLISSCQLVITDSGGIQEETTFRQIPCLTLRENTERPSTTEIGTNTLISFDLQIVKEKIREIKSGEYKKGAIPELWDGKATERIVKILSEIS